LKNFTSYQQ